MPVRARLCATVPASLPPEEGDVPELCGPPGRRLLVRRGDDALVVQALDDGFAPVGGPVRVPAPWPRRRGGYAVSPDAGLVVFAGVHAVRAVEPSGATRWEVRHGCWSGPCQEAHSSYDDYAGRDDHRYPKRGSAGFSADGKTVWAHVSGPLSTDGPGAQGYEEWLLLDAGDGRVLARADTLSAAEGSFHLPHPADPARMWLTIGEGQDGSPLRAGRFDGEELAVDHIDEDLALMSVSPSGARLMTVAHDQGALAVRDGRCLLLDGLEWDACVVPRHPGAEPGNDEVEAFWDWAGGFLDETTLICSTVESDEEWGEGRHWIVATTGGAGAPALVEYPVPVGTRGPTALGDGRWWTLSDAGDELLVWAREQPGE
ncbi:hypothetical protein ACIPRD_23160 [Streptomyces sp. NPDC090108]|uniref:hypothetical protein n=1 Tax=Streptomyces sp. NPDC090108 TaxID=3365947 RepID=UPI0037FAFFD7